MDLADFRGSCTNHERLDHRGCHRPESRRHRQRDGQTHGRIQKHFFKRQHRHRGALRLSASLAGNIKLSVEASGFKKFERTGILLVANDKLTLGDLAMQVGATNETVTVTAEATLVQAESAERSYAVQGEIVRNIAVNGRGFINLASIATGVVFNNNVGNSDAITNVAANGLRTSANNLQLDGVAIVDTGNNGTMISVNLDAIAEFKVLTSNYQAEFGRSAG